MIASSSEELLRQVDADISDKFRFLIWDLFSDTMAGENPNAGDGLDTTTSSLDNGKLQRWTECAEFYGWQGKVAAIILLDQMSRHIHRHDQKHQNNINQQPSIPLAKFIPKQKELDSLAYKISTTLQKHHCKELSTGMIPLPMRIFGIMPLRHASTVHDLGIVQNDVELGSTLNEEMDRMIRRFRKATNRRMAALQDDARRNGKLGLLNEENGRSSSTGDENMKMYESDNANTEKNGGEIVSMEETFQDDQILECFPFEADMTPALDHIVTKTIRTFLNETNVLHTTDLHSNGPKRKSKSSHDKPSSMNSSTPDHVPAAIVSLSGGVDSMVIASALACIRDAEATRLGANPDDILRIYAIHIDYANRPEAGAEAAYVERYSRQLGAEFVCRRIGEVTRGVTARDDYERIAREIRFGLYRQCCKEAKGSNSDVGIGIMLGHHRGT